MKYTCVQECCIKRPNFNLASKTTRLYCFEHKKENMIDVTRKRCIQEGCIKRPNFNLTFGAVPQLIENGSVPQKGAFLIQDFIDQRATAHEVNIKSAGVAIPVAVDQIYTGQPVA